MPKRWRPSGGALIETPVRQPAIRKPIPKTARRLAAAAMTLAALGPASSVLAQPYDCRAYARAYADAHTSPDPTDLEIFERGARGAVAGGIWEGPSGAERGAAIGGALAVLDKLGNYPAGWHSLHDLAYRMCRNAQSGVNHRPSTLGNPAYYGRPPVQRQQAAPPLEPRPDYEPPSPPPPPPPAAPRH